MSLLPPLLLLLGALAAAALPYAVVERRWRWRWREVEIGRLAVHTGSGLFRDAGTVPTYLRGAPLEVRAAAFTCLLFGQMFVPGLALGAIGLLFGGLGIVSIPGLIAAAKLYTAGLTLLRREPPDAYWKLRNAIDWALWLNGVLFALSLLALLLTRCRVASSFWPLFILINGYGALSVAQALYCRRVIARFEDALFQPTREPKL